MMALLGKLCHVCRYVTGNSEAGARVHCSINCCFLGEGNKSRRNIR